MIKEKQLYNPALKLMEKHGGFITTEDLIEELVVEFNPTGKDAEIVENRNDTYFSQKVRNIISHKGSPNNIINIGLAKHDEKRHGLIITESGREHLKLIR